MRLQFKKEWVIPTVTGVVSFAAGVAGGYFLALRMTKTSEEEYEGKLIDANFRTEENERLINHTIQQLNHVLREDREERQMLHNRYIDEANDRHPAGTTLEVVTEVEESKVIRIFRDEDDGWDYGEEEANRQDPEKPYILHRDEYLSNESGYPQQTITYYAGDNILCDEHDVPVYNPELIVGEMRFGHGSGDPNCLYVRNDGLMAEYEIILDRGSYQVEVLGATIEEEAEKDDLRHSREPRRFRMD